MQTRLQPRRRLRAQADDRQVVHAERPLDSARAQVRERPVRRGRSPTPTRPRATKKNRPAYKSDAGRVVYGGGGITPDVIVPDDTLTTAEQQLREGDRAEAAGLLHGATTTTRSSSSKTVGQGLHGAARSGATSSTAASQAKGVTVDRKDCTTASAATSIASLDQRVARFAFGDSTAKRRDLPYDAPLRKAIELLDKGTTQRSSSRIAGEPLRTPTAQAKRQ